MHCGLHPPMLKHTHHTYTRFKNSNSNWPLTLTVAPPCDSCYILVVHLQFFTSSTESAHTLKTCFYISGNPCTSLLPHLCWHGTGEAVHGALPTARTATWSVVFLVVLSNSFYLLGPQFAHPSQVKVICSILPCCCWG